MAGRVAREDGMIVWDGDVSVKADRKVEPKKSPLKDAGDEAVKSRSHRTRSATLSNLLDGRVDRLRPLEEIFEGRQIQAAEP